MKNMKLIDNEVAFFETKEVDGIKTEYAYEKQDDRIIVKTSVKNTSREDIYPGDFKIFDKIQINFSGGYDKVYTECKDLLGFCGPQALDKKWTSYSTVGLMSSSRRESILAGFTDVRRHFYSFTAEKNKDGVDIIPYCPFEGTKIKPGEKISLSDLVLIDKGSLQKDFDTYSGYLSENLGGFSPEKGLPTGYCTWYYHYGTEKSEDLYNVTGKLSKSPFRDTLDYILIDDGWNNSLEAKKSNWGDWYTKDKYPEGMKHVSGYIHGKGFKAGLWLAPFAVTNNSEIFKNHPDWILGRGDDLLNNGGEVYGLDLTHPKACEFLEDTIKRVFYEWEFDFIKIDFLLYGALETDKRHDPDFTGSMAFRKGMEIIRDCTGPDKMVLNCGSPVLQSAGCCDTMRIGADVGSRWHFPLNDGMWQYGNCSIKPAMRYTIYRHWMHNNLWFNDPDCIVARSSSNKIEHEEFSKWFPGMVKDESGFGLSRNEMCAWVKLVWITGGARLLSDELDELEDDRKDLIVKLFEAEEEKTVLIDDYRNDDIAVFKTRDDDSKIAIFNLSDDAVNHSIPSDVIGIDSWDYSEITENITLKGNGDEIVFPEIPPRSGYIFSKNRR